MEEIVDKYLGFAEAYQKSPKVNTKIFYMSAQVCGIIESIGAEAVQKILNDYEHMVADDEEKKALKAVKESGEGLA